MRLYSPLGERLYLNAHERGCFLQIANEQSEERKLFCLCLFYTGCRLSEARNLTASQLQQHEGIIAIRSLKKRNQNHIREIPVPKAYVRVLKSYAAKVDISIATPIWPISRITAWRWIKDVMNKAEINGKQATAKGLRHSFGVWASMNNIPPSLIQRWMGHARVETTLIYMQLMGEEERGMARRMWSQR